MLIFSLVYKKWVAFNIHLKQGSTDIFKINFLFIFLFFLYIVKFFAHSLSFVHCIVLRIFFFFSFLMLHPYTQNYFMPTMRWNGITHSPSST